MRRVFKINISNKKKNLSLPVTPENVRSLKMGDIVYITGTIIAGRDHFHKRVLEYAINNENLPVSFNKIRNCALYHMGPIVKQHSNGEYQIISGGPTTSARMNDSQSEVAKILDVRLIIGKGGMKNIDWNNIPAVYLHYPGGAGAIVTKFIKKIIEVEWLDLGTPEAAWIFDVENFGPLVVTIDTHGNSMYN